MLDNFVYTIYYKCSVRKGSIAKKFSDIISIHNNKIYYETKKKYDKKTADKWLEDEFSGALYCHDAPSTSFYSYCYAYELQALAEKGLYFLPKSNTMIAAFDKKYLFSQIGIFPKIADMLNHLNENCPAFKRSRLVNKLADGNLKSGYVEYQEDGTEIIKGMQSIIACVSFMDNPDAGRGFDGNKIVVEEAGTFANWSESYNAMEPSIKDGDYYTGTMIVFGTGGDMEGGTIDFAEMFYNPDNYNMMPFENVWDKENTTDKTCG